jgi:L-fucose mutarotase
MLRTALLHPHILQALASAGHGSTILIADSNYPVTMHTAATTAQVYLNVSPGLVSVSQVLEALLPLVPVEAAHVMQPAPGEEPPIFALFRQYLPEGGGGGGGGWVTPPPPPPPNPTALSKS